MLQDALTWLSNSPDESLGFILADNGFDVWLANVRGTNYSSGHTSLSPNDPEYWDWSWDELVEYDLPAFVQYVNGQTGQKLHYVGHSLGTLMAFGAFSREEVLNMVRSAALLSPIAYMGQMPSPLARAAADIFTAEALILHEFFKLKSCSPTTYGHKEHDPSSPEQGTIAMYDYGSDDDNNKHYGQTTPPDYNMTSIPNDLPLFLGYGGEDLLSDVKDVQTLIDALSDHDPDKLVLQYIQDYAHLDFVYAVNAKQVVYDPLVAFFRLN
ncbi:Triacylglycerol lipase 2 [Sesamum angolense]|uniref:Triacylglycerol lipase 2 n=1 Tax=Sesamum angolense TaxID=2727404 RepID=A0AAE2BU31_9LAMI|nr:Triacylglycerol lipase 2 [Sesamum angolense]